MLYKQPTSVATLRKYMSCSYPRNINNPIYYFLSGDIGALGFHEEFPRSPRFLVTEPELAG